jgi:hypothetical protein
MLLHLSEQIAARIEKALKERRYRDAASAFNSLRELTVIDHVTVERLLTTQAQLVTRVVAGQVSEFKAHCHFERFHDASNALEELQLVGGAFAVSLVNLVPSQELRQYLNDCKQKYHGQQQREKDLQSAQQEGSQALRLMAEQKRDMELRLEEQQTQYEALIAELTRQIANTGAEYEKMKGELKKELDQRMRTTQSELVAKHGQDEVKLAKRMSEEQTRLQKEYDAKLHAAEVARDAVLQGQKRQQERAEKEQRAQKQATRDRLVKLRAAQERAPRSPSGLLQSMLGSATEDAVAEKAAELEVEAEAIEEVEGLLLHLDPRPSHVEVPSVFEEVGGEDDDPFDDDEGEDEMETESETVARPAAAAADSQQQHHHSSSSHAHHNISHPIHSHGRGAGRAPSSSSAAPAVASPPVQASAPAAIMDRMKTLAKSVTVSLFGSRTHQPTASQFH